MINFLDEAMIDHRRFVRSRMQTTRSIIVKLAGHCQQEQELPSINHNQGKIFWKGSVAKGERSGSTTGG